MQSDEWQQTYSALIARVKHNRAQLALWTRGKRMEDSPAATPSASPVAKLDLLQQQHQAQQPQQPQPQPWPTPPISPAGPEYGTPAVRSRRPTSGRPRPATARAVMLQKAHTKNQDVSRWTSGISSGAATSHSLLNAEEPTPDSIPPLPPAPDYSEPPPPPSFWPPERPPTLHQMEVDMKLVRGCTRARAHEPTPPRVVAAVSYSHFTPPLRFMLALLICPQWAQCGHELKAKAEHTGRLLEFRRAKAAFSDLVLRDERLSAFNAQLVARVTALEASGSAAVARTSLLEEQGHEAAEARADAERRLAEVQTQRDKLESVAAAFSKEVRGLRERTAALEAERLGAQGRARDVEAGARRAMEGLDSKMASRESQICRLEAELEAKAEALEAAAAQVEVLQGQLAAQEELHGVEAARVREERAAEAEEHAMQLAKLQAAVEAHAATATAQERARMADAARSREIEITAQRERKLAAAAARLAAEQKEQRMEEVMRMLARRMLHRDVSGAFAAWIELWEAKTYALNRMRQIANMLHPKTRELARCFTTWADTCRDVTHERQLESAGTTTAALRRELDLKDKEIARLKSAVAKLMPQETAGAYAKNKREKQVRAYERKRQQQASRDERAAARS